MISYSNPAEKPTILHYAELMSDQLTKEIIHKDQLSNKDEALHLAKFFWRMVERSNQEDKETGESTEYILEKIIITFMAYFRSAGYGEVWESVEDDN